MYVGLALIVAGLGIALASDWTLVMLVPAMLLIHFGVVEREERYLEAKFGDAYRHTKRKCRVTAGRANAREISKSFRQSSICAARVLLL